MILDTSFVIALRSDERARELANEHEAGGLPRWLPAVAVSELYVGVGLGDRAHHTARAYEELIANVPVVPTDGNIARRAGVLAGIHAGSDSKPTLGLADATIAATALVLGEPVVTRDREDFGSVDDLEVVSW